MNGVDWYRLPWIPKRSKFFIQTCQLYRLCGIFMLHANGKYLGEKTNSFFNECLSWSCMFFGCYIFIQSDPKIKSPKTSSKKNIAGDVGSLTPPAPSTQDTFFPHRAPGKGGRSPWRSRRRRRRRDRCVIPSEALPVRQWCFAGPLSWVAGWVGLGRFSRMPWGLPRGSANKFPFFFKGLFRRSANVRSFFWDWKTVLERKWMI